jgi:hypothetical protein
MLYGHFGMLCGQFVCFKVIWYVYGYLVCLWVFGMFMGIWYVYGYLVFLVILYFILVLVYCTKKYEGSFLKLA